MMLIFQKNERRNSDPIIVIINVVVLEFSVFMLFNE